MSLLFSMRKLCCFLCCASTCVYTGIVLFLYVYTYAHTGLCTDRSGCAFPYQHDGAARPCSNGRRAALFQSTCMFVWSGAMHACLPQCMLLSTNLGSCLCFIHSSCHVCLVHVCSMYVAEIQSCSAGRCFKYWGNHSMRVGLSLSCAALVGWPPQTLSHLSRYV